jgi:glycosyl hydrolase family 25/putative peptidoglycan binding protein
VTVKIVDVSHHNATVDMAKLKAGGFAAVIQKATQGVSYVDPTYASRRAAAKKAGLPFGAYHMCEPDQDPIAQVDHFLAVVAKSAKPELRLALDVELATKTSPSVVAGRYNAMAERTERLAGHTVIVYTYPWYAQAGYCAGLGDELLWMADYSGTLHVPDEWKGRWVLWQRGQRPVPGVSAGDGPGTDFNTAPSLGPLLVVPPKPVATTVTVTLPALRPGAKGPAVTSLQVLLTGHGLACPPSGSYDAATRKQVDAFKKAHKLGWPGIVGQRMWALLLTK